jgi:hypothetical protein
MGRERSLHRALNLAASWCLGSLATTTARSKMDCPCSTHQPGHCAACGKELCDGAIVVFLLFSCGEHEYCPPCVIENFEPDRYLDDELTELVGEAGS